MPASSEGQTLTWRRSRYCADQACVEVAVDGDGAVVVRDGKHREGPFLAFPAVNWKAFVSDVNDGRFDD